MLILAELWTSISYYDYLTDHEGGAASKPRL